MAAEASTPEGIVGALSASSERIETPCGDGSMVWRAWGQGPALVLLHGGHGSWTHWLRSIEALSAEYRVFAADMPGYGESGSPPDAYTAESLAEILSRGVDSLLPDGEPFAIAGFSFGGVIGGHLAKLRGKQVRRLVLVGSGGLALSRKPMEQLQTWRHLPPDQQPTAHRFNLGILMLKDPARIDSLAVHLQTQNAARTRINSVAIANTDTLRRCLPEVTAPLAGIWGEADATAAPFLGERRKLLGSIDRQAEFVVIEGAGHWVMYEAPEAFNRALLEILRKDRTGRS